MRAAALTGENQLLRLFKVLQSREYRVPAIISPAISFRSSKARSEFFSVTACSSSTAVSSRISP